MSILQKVRMILDTILLLLKVKLSWFVKVAIFILTKF